MRTTVFGLLLSIVLLSASVLIAAQTPTPPPPSNDPSPDSWGEFTSEKGRFRIRFPGKPKEESSLGVHYHSYNGLLKYRISYTDEPDLSDSLDSAKKYLKESRAVTAAILAVSAERIVDEKEVTIDGYPGHFTYTQSDTGWVRDLQVVAGKRVYTVVVEGRRGRANVLEEKNDFERVAMAFINSFKVISPAVKPIIGMLRPRNTADLSDHFSESN